MKKLSFIVLAFTFDVSIAYGDISREMCKEYAKSVYTLQPDLGLSSETGFNNVSECAIVPVPLIIGGEQAIEKEFPHFALVGFGNKSGDDVKWECGASLISKNFVMTAAHCAYSTETGRALKVKLGIINLEDKDEDKDIIKEVFVKTITKHPEYKPPSKYNDIALFELENDVAFTPFIRPACLNTKSNIKEHSVIGIGFGKTSQDDDEGSKNLMKVTLNLINNTQCNNYFSHQPQLKNGVVPSMICAGVLEGGKDTCQGDSGSPTQTILEEPYCMYNIIGVTSFGRFCGYPNSPAIYTNVSHYIPWIESIVWKNK